MDKRLIRYILSFVTHRDWDFTSDRHKRNLTTRNPIWAKKLLNSYKRGMQEDATDDDLQECYGLVLETMVMLVKRRKQISSIE